VNVWDSAGQVQELTEVIEGLDEIHLQLGCTCGVTVGSKSAVSSPLACARAARQRSTSKHSDR